MKNSTEDAKRDGKTTLEMRVEGYNK